MANLTKSQVCENYRVLIPLIAVLVGACASIQDSPELNPDASAPVSPRSTWIPDDKRPANRSLDDLFALPPMSQEDPSTQEAPSPENASGILQNLDGSVPPSSPTSPLDLPQLIDVALEKNPQTRAAWQRSRIAAAEVGESMSDYYPDLSFEAVGGYSKRALPFPDGTAVYKGADIIPQLEITYILLDFGRRTASAESARRRLAAANFSFNRELQRVIYNVESSFYEYDAARALEAAASMNLDLALSVLDDVHRRLELGLATRPDLLLARQVEAQAIYDLESAKVTVFNARSKLALAMGLPANSELHVVNLFDQPLPAELETKVEAMIDLALAQRPDLQAQVARLRASEAELKKAKAAFFPTIGVEGAYGGQWGDYSLYGADVGAPGINTEQRRHGIGSIYNAQLVISWPLFEGFSRKNRVRQARANQERQREILRAIELEATNEVWGVYNDYQASYRRYEYGAALLEASEEAYEATRESYDNGLRTIDDLLRAERDLSAARYTLIGARAELLSTAARLGFALGQITVSAQEVQ
ncbi:MAG: TolC family protein [Myxococcota bacterium]|nr:TolC family protein [Myxococcota bacterium]